MAGCNNNTNKSYFKQFAGRIPSRLILYFLSLSCIIISFLMRTIINFTILAMVKENSVGKILSNNSSKLGFLNENTSYHVNNYGGILEWSIDVQYYVLTVFLWTYILSQTVGAVVAHKYGSKVVIGLALLTSSVCSMCIPIGSEMHYIVVILIQLLHGFAQGVVWPAMYTMISWWIPLQEKSRYVSCFHGLTIGAATSHFMSGYIIAYFGWKYVFYTAGVLGIMWCSIWCYLAYDKPELHPRMSSHELNYIKENRQQNLQILKQKVPWKSILCSLPVWAVAVSSFGRLWIQATIIVYGPMYLKTVIGLEVQMNGLWSSIASLMAFVWGLISAYASDKMVILNVMSTVMTRKLFTVIGLLFCGILSISISYLNCNSTLNLLFWILLQMFLTTAFTGTMTNIVDIAPNFSGPVSSVVQVIIMSTSVLSTYVARGFLNDESTTEPWKGIFNTSAGVVFTATLFYIIFASGDVQEWDKASNEVGDKDEFKEMTSEELQVIHT